jgi:hypothetical protein
MQINFNSIISAISAYKEPIFKVVSANRSQTIVALAVIAIGIFAAAIYKLAQACFSHQSSKKHDVKIVNVDDISEPSQEILNSIDEPTDQAQEIPKPKHPTKTRPMQAGKRPPTRKTLQQRKAEAETKDHIEEKAQAEKIEAKPQIETQQVKPIARGGSKAQIAQAIAQQAAAKLNANKQAKLTIQPL